MMHGTMNVKIYILTDPQSFVFECPIITAVEMFRHIGVMAPSHCQTPCSTPPYLLSLLDLYFGYKFFSLNSARKLCLYYAPKVSKNFDKRCG